MAAPALETLVGEIKYAGEKVSYGIGSDAKGKITVGSGDTTFNIYPTSISAQPEAEMKEIKGPTGQTISLIVPVQSWTLSGDGYISMADAEGGIDLSKIQKGDPANLGTLGEILSIPDADTARVESISVQFANEDVTKLSFSFKTYPQITSTSAT